MRVVAGELGGRRLVAPPGTATRPTTDRVREAVFNSLASAGVIEGALVVDLYAGSGAMGIEALSRGAAQCTFVETGREATRALESNLRSLGLEDRSRIVRADAATTAGALDADLVLADPPYGFDDWARLLESISATTVVAEADRALEAPSGWRVSRARRYGRTWVTYLVSEPAADVARTSVDDGGDAGSVAAATDPDVSSPEQLDLHGSVRAAE